MSADVTSTQQAIAKGKQFGQITRPARALLGWMAQEEGELTLVERQVTAVTPEHSQRVTQAREAVAARPSGVDQSNLLEDLPAAPDEHVEQLRAHSAFGPFAREGRSFKLADLSKVCAVQPVVFWDHAQVSISTDLACSQSG